MDTTKKRYYLNSNELAVLMANSGIKSLYGLGSAKPMDNKDICMVLHSLYVNKIIDNYNQEGFVIDKDVREIMGIIRKSRYVMAVNAEKTDHILKCCYLGEKIAVVSIDEKSRDIICIYAMDKDEIVDELMQIAAEGNSLSISLKNVSDGQEREKVAISAETTKDFINGYISKYCKEE